MRRLLLAAALLLLASAPAASAPGREAGFVPIRAGDQLRIDGSTVGCVVQEAAVLCGRYSAAPAAGAMTLRVGSYGTVAIAGGKAVAVFRVAGATTLKTVARRWPKGLPSIPLRYDPGESVERVVHLAVGQVARVSVQGLKLDCAVVRSGTRNVPTVYCATDDKVGPVLGTYATLASDEDVALGKIGAGRRTTIVWVRKQP